MSDHAGTHIDAPIHFNPKGTGKLFTFSDWARTIEKILSGSSHRLGTGTFSSATDTRAKTVLDIEASLKLVSCEL
jgi:hypothetical protein